MWSRFDGDAFDHPKWAGAPLSLIGFYCQTHTYCSRWLTDGRVPAAQVRGKRRQGLADELVRRRIWHRAKGIREACTACWEMVDGEPGDGWVVHDYLKLNLSKAEAERRYAESRAIRVAGGKARAASAGRDHGKFAPADDQQHDQQATSRQPAERTSRRSYPVVPVDPIGPVVPSGGQSIPVNADGIAKIVSMARSVGKPVPAVSPSEIRAEAGRVYKRVLSREELA